MAQAQPATHLETVFADNRRYLWGLCYRMTGSAADADDLVQDTFARALAKPPPDTSRPWRPWLTRVAVNLSRDHLRRRRRAPYVGPWLPSPIETDPVEEFVAEEERAFEPRSTQGRYELLESVSFAFLLALETLTPAQRAVLLLCDVIGYSGREAALALDMTEANVRQTLGRARRAMAQYDAARTRLDQDACSETQDALARFMLHMAAGNVGELEKLLGEDVVAVNDGAGKYFAARVPVVGRNKVARFHAKLVRQETPRIAVRNLNGLPAFVGEFDDAVEGYARRFVSMGWLDAEGRIHRIHTIVADQKLAAIAPLPPG